MPTRAAAPAASPAPTGPGGTDVDAEPGHHGQQQEREAPTRHGRGRRTTGAAATEGAARSASVEREDDEERPLAGALRDELRDDPEREPEDFLVEVR